jgi:ribosomal protein S18 acetylase RimI-like enzyme
MRGLVVEPFSEAHLDAAGELLAERHARHRQAEPLLPERFEDPKAARGEVEALFHSEGASGVVAIRDGRVAGYVLGIRKEDARWGPNVSVESAGHAAEEPEVVRDLYGAAAARWVDAGRTRHYVLAPASDDQLVDAWFRVGFGQQHAHGVREVARDLEVAIPDRVEIRGPREEEIEQLIDIELALPEHQRAAPVFSTAPEQTREESRNEWRRTLAANDEQILIGAYDGQPAACWAFVPVERSSANRGLLVPERCAFLGFAATLPEFRAHGIGVALTDAGLAWAAKAGYQAVLTDWRVTNLLSSRFWPKRGFRETFLRLYRSIP